MQPSRREYCRANLGRHETFRFPAAYSHDMRLSEFHTDQHESPSGISYAGKIAQILGLLITGLLIVFLRSFGGW